jgi:hypothetical protein
MSEGNHLASQGQAEYDKKGSCPSCGSLDLSEILWCENDHVECAPECPSYNPGFNCPMESNKLKCVCGYIMEAQ